MSDSNPMTVKQRLIFGYIVESIVTKQRPPTVREIGKEFGITSQNGVVCHLVALEKKGLIVREPCARGIRVVDLNLSTDKAGKEA